MEFLQSHSCNLHTLLQQKEHDNTYCLPMFCVQVSRGHSEDFFVNVEVVVVNPNVVEISASSNKHTFSHEESVLWYIKQNGAAKSMWSELISILV